MILNYLKGSSACVLSAVFSFFLLSALFEPGTRLDNAFAEFYSYLTVATFIGFIGGLLATWILRLYSDENLFSKDLVAIFAVAGFAIGILLDLLFGLALFPTFTLSGIVGALVFLSVQKISNKLMGWSIVAVHLGFLFISPQVSSILAF